MPIRVQCGGGHTLKVGLRLAGQTVRCPKCQAEVVVPQGAGLSEQAILEFLGPPPGSGGEAEATKRPVDLGRPTVLMASAMKLCPKCKREVRACYDLCPHCKTYFTDLAEIRRRLA